MSDDITADKVQALITRAPYHQWLGLQVLALHDDGIDLKATWREEWVVNPERRYTHGGVLAALVDLAADWALVKRTGRGVPTVDLRVDYHAAAMPGDLTEGITYFDYPANPNHPAAWHVRGGNGHDEDRRVGRQQRLVAVIDDSALRLDDRLAHDAIAASGEARVSEELR